jgi:hypothetical protein
VQDAKKFPKGLHIPETPSRVDKSGEEGRRGLPHSLNSARECNEQHPPLQVERDLGMQLLTQDFQLSKAQLDVYNWKRRAAMLQLKLESRQEDLGHLQVSIIFGA